VNHRDGVVPTLRQRAGPEAVHASLGLAVDDDRAVRHRCLRSPNPVRRLNDALDAVGDRGIACCRFDLDGCRHASTCKSSGGFDAG